MEFALFSMLNILDIIYLISIPIILFLLLKTERNSRKRLDNIVNELKETNRLLSFNQHQEKN